MGAVFRAPEQQVSSEFAISQIRGEAQRICDAVYGTRWYLFGSFARNPAAATDIDVLVVCKSHEDAIRVRYEVQSICLDWPLHLLLMTEREERQTNFIYSEKCAPLVMPTRQLEWTSL